MSDLQARPPISIALPEGMWQSILAVLSETTGFPLRVTGPLHTALAQGLQAGQGMPPAFQRPPRPQGAVPVDNAS